MRQFNQKGYRKYICENYTIGISNDIKAHSLEEKPNDENANIIEQNRVMRKTIEELEKRQELLRKGINDQETTIKIKNQTAKRRDSITANVNESFQEDGEFAGNEKDILNSIETLLEKKLENIAEKMKESVINELLDNTKTSIKNSMKLSTGKRLMPNLLKDHQMIIKEVTPKKTA